MTRGAPGHEVDPLATTAALTVAQDICSLRPDPASGHREESSQSMRAPEPSPAPLRSRGATERGPAQARMYDGGAEEFAETISPSLTRTHREEGTGAGTSPLLRAIEIAIAATMLILTLPLMLLIAAIITADSPGRALFFQTRIGRNGRRFTFVKFRTLYADAQRRFPELYAYRYSADDLRTLRFKIDNDPRVTPQGRWLRKSSLDELPNFWNVLTGDMALVGPRPEIPEMLPYYTGDMLSKFSVRPGITGLAQISGRGRLTFLETVACDLEYVRNRSLTEDAKILFKTAKMILLRDGAF